MATLRMKAHKNCNSIAQAIGLAIVGGLEMQMDVPQQAMKQERIGN